MTQGLLLDTQALLDLRAGGHLPRRTRTALSAPGAQIHLSVASVWEIAIKLSRGPALQIGLPLSEFVEAAVASGLRLLQIAPEHLYEVQRLPWHHKDSFDRLIAAQSLIEKLPIVGTDEKFDPYGVKRIWS